MSEEDKGSLLAIVARAVREVDGGVEVDSTSVDRDFSEIGLDSVGALDVVGRVERALGIHLSDEELTRIASVSDLIRAIRGHTA